MGDRKSISTLESLHFRDFRWLWLGALASFMAMNMQMIARGWLILTLTKDSPFALSLVMMAFALPMTIMSPIGGSLADRFSRKSIVIFSQAGNTLMTLVLATLDVTGLVKFWHLMAIGVANGSLFALNMPSRQSLISDLVPSEMLMNAISLNNSAMNLSRVVGPALAGFLIIYLDTAGAFYLIAFFYLCSALSTTLVRVKAENGQRSRNTIFEEIKEGFSYAAGHKTLSGLIVMLFVPALFGFPSIALLPAWAREALNVQSDGLGLLVAVFGFGALAGSLMLASVRNMSKRGRFLLVLALGWGLGIGLMAMPVSYTTAVPILLVIGLANAQFMSMNMTLLQTYVASEMRGRVMSISMMTFGAMPLSVIPFGALAEKIGTPVAVGLSGVMLVAFTLIFAWIKPDFREIA
jgi:predicted MFS family arabinose efflux permease